MKAIMSIIIAVLLLSVVWMEPADDASMSSLILWLVWTAAVGAAAVFSAVKMKSW